MTNNKYLKVCRLHGKRRSVIILCFELLSDSIVHNSFLELAHFLNVNYQYSDREQSQNNNDEMENPNIGWCRLLSVVRVVVVAFFDFFTYH